MYIELSEDPTLTQVNCSKMRPELDSDIYSAKEFTYGLP